MIEASCHCGAVRLRIASPPNEVTDCNCSICRRYGVLWAYYAPSDIELSNDNETDTYLWGPRSTAFHRCSVCGCVTHWSGVDPERGRMGVNARLMAPQVLAQAKVRRLDGANTWQYLDE
ncbi:GFA family protein [Consotaella aegiceratis]|uniref:GFA family protein n=1 Tax=Consotaella aegiceratis TaxID=3097961 RepID=UPI002F41769D